MSTTTLNKMSHMKLLGMLRSYQSMLGNHLHNDLTHDEVVETLVQAEWEDRENKKINRHLRLAKFRYGACIEEINFTARRGLDKPRYSVCRMEAFWKRKKTYLLQALPELVKVIFLRHSATRLVNLDTGLFTLIPKNFYPFKDAEGRWILCSGNQQDRKIRSTDP